MKSSSHPASSGAARPSDSKPLDALLATLTTITGVLLLTLVLLALFARHPSLDLLKALAFLAMVVGSISLALSRALVQTARAPKKIPARPVTPAWGSRPMAKPMRADRRRGLDRRRFGSLSRR